MHGYCGKRNTGIDSKKVTGPECLFKCVSIYLEGRDGIFACNIKVSGAFTCVEANNVLYHLVGNTVINEIAPAKH